jgi:hypothetical protein
MVAEPSFSGQQLGSGEILKQLCHPLLLAKVHQCSNNISSDLVEPYIILLPLFLPMAANHIGHTIA